MCVDVCLCVSLQVQDVLDGDIDGFIGAFLRHIAQQKSVMLQNNI